MISNNPLQDVILSELSNNKEHSVQTLHKVISKKEKISLSQFYKIIDQLLEKQILAKEGGKLVLHSRRILSLLELTDNIRKNYFEENTTLKIDLKEGSQKVYYASSLVDLDNIWANILNTLGVMYGKKESFYFYNSHTYHILGMPETESSNFRQMSNQSHKVYFLTGNETPLDLYGADLLRLQGTEVVCSEKAKFLKEGYFVNIVGEYIIEVLLPDMLTQYLKVFFDNTQKTQDFNSELFHNIFKMKTECKCTLRRSSSQAEAFKKEIKRFFK